MIPYRPTPTSYPTSQKPQKQPSIPSLEFVHTLSTLCQLSQTNSYDPKNHILTINDLNSFENAVQHKYGRSFRLFQKQLRVLGWRLRRYKAEGDKEDVRVYRWKGKKQLLIDEQLNTIDTGLKQRKSELQQTRANIRQIRKNLDNKFESLLFSLLINSNIQQASVQLQKLLKQTKVGVNNIQLSIHKIINKISITLGNQLQLYKLLIYKQGVSDKKVQGMEREEDGEFEEDGDGEEDRDDERDGEGEGDEDRGDRESEDRNNGVIEEEEYGSRNSIVSIQMDQQVKKELQKNQSSQKEVKAQDNV